MKTIKRFILMSAFVSLTAGCVSHLTPMAVNVPIVPSEVAKSKLLGENCSRIVLFAFGPFGDTSIKEILERNKNSKVTFIDYKVSNFFVMQEYCSQVYGY